MCKAEEDEEYKAQCEARHQLYETMVEEAKRQLREMSESGASEREQDNYLEDFLNELCARTDWVLAHYAGFVLMDWAYSTGIWK